MLNLYLILLVFLLYLYLSSFRIALKQILLFSYLLFYVRIIKYFIFIVWLCPYTSPIFAGTPYVFSFLSVTTFTHTISQKYQLIKL